MELTYKLKPSTRNPGPFFYTSSYSVDMEVDQLQAADLT